MSATDADRAPLATGLAGAAHNVLLLAPPMDACGAEGCHELLTVEPPAGADVLFVTLTASPDARLDDWDGRAAIERPANLGFVSVGDDTRSAAVPGPLGAPDGGPSVRSVSSPGDLTDLGIAVSEYLAEWDGDGNRVAVCLDSLTTLLQYVDLHRAFRFLHVVTGRVRATDGLAHYHMDPTAHEEQTINTLTQLFDGVARWTGTDWRVQYR